jgi:hypothetical protein
VVVEPAAIVAEEPQGMRSLYVALTRATKLLTLVHRAPLPPVLAAGLDHGAPGAATSPVGSPTPGSPGPAVGSAEAEGA